MISTKYGELYEIDNAEMAVINIVSAAREYAVTDVTLAYGSPHDSSEYWHGYQDGIRTALSALGLQGEAFGKIIASIFDGTEDPEPSVPMRIAQVVYATDTEAAGRIQGILTDRAIVRWDSGRLANYPLSAFGYGHPYENLYVDVDKEVL